MQVLREEKKQEAIRRMQKFGLFGPCINAFKNHDEVQLTEPTGGLYEFHQDEVLNNKIAKFEEEQDALVYHVIHSYTEFGELYAFLFVSDNKEEEWEGDFDDISRHGESVVFSYVWNKSEDLFSEFGSIVIRQLFGGLVRIA